MRTIAVVIAALIAAGGCKNGGRWREARATTVEVGDYVVRIPQGWRSLDELADDELRTSVKLADGAQGLVPEDIREGYTPSIVLASTSVEGLEIDEAICRDLADQVKQTTPNGLITDVQSATFDGEPGCTWNFVVPNQSGRALARFHGTDMLLALCTWNGEGTKELADICAKTLASIKLR